MARRAPPLSQRPVDAQLCEVLDRVLHRGAVVRGEVIISVAEIDLLYLDVRVFLSSIDTALDAGAITSWGGGRTRSADERQTP